ncbi:MAG: DNA polymerase III subunit delta' [Cocleimonas sp.]|nr:DNA polymerase III subunit delta' [Cocleimonas sp.]
MIKASIYPWHQKAWNQLITARHQQRLPHALLLAGISGIGKQSFAKAFINSLLCESPLEEGQACYQCKSCKVHKAGTHPDYKQVLLAADKTQIVIDQIRSLNDFLHISRSYQRYRVVLISPAESLNLNAANSLLKSLEEPTAYSVIILLSSQPSVLLPTVKSRCQQLTLAPPHRTDAIHWLQTQSVQHDPEMLLALSGGRPLTALSFDHETPFKMRQDFLADLSLLLKGEKSITEMSKKWQNNSKQTLLDWQIIWAQQLIKQQFVQNKDQTLSLPLSKTVDLHALWSLHDELLKLKKMTHTSLNAQSFIETMLLLWLKL